MVSMQTLELHALRLPGISDNICHIRFCRKSIFLKEKSWKSQTVTIFAGELKLISLVIGDREDSHYQISDPEPVEFIKFMMEQKV